MRNQGVILAVAISFLVISFVFIYVSQFYIPNQTRKMAESYQAQYSTKGVFVVTGEDGLAEGTIITEELFNEGTIDIQNIPSAFIPRKNNQELVYTTGEVDGSNKMAYRQVIIGKVVKTKVEPGSIITYASLGEGEEVMTNSFEKQIQLQIENTVGDSLKTGKYVDVIVKYENGEYDVVASKKIVDSVITTGTSDATQAQSTDGAAVAQKITATTDGVILVSVNDIEYRDIELADRLGTLSIRLYKSVDQYPSTVTFNYLAKMKEVNQKIVELELVGSHTNYFDEYSMLLDGGKTNVDKTSELYVFMEWYSDIYYRILPSIEGKRVYENKQEAENYIATEGSLNDGSDVEDATEEKSGTKKVYTSSKVTTLEEVANANDLTVLDVIIAMIMGNEKIYSVSNRLEIFNSHQKADSKTSTGIRITVASELVSKVFSYYTKYSGTNVDSLAYLIENKFITSVNF